MIHRLQKKMSKEELRRWRETAIQQAINDKLLDDRSELARVVGTSDSNLSQILKRVGTRSAHAKALDAWLKENVFNEPPEPVGDEFSIIRGYLTQATLLTKETRFNRKSKLEFLADHFAGLSKLCREQVAEIDA